MKNFIGQKDIKTAIVMDNEHFKIFGCTISEFLVNGNKHFQIALIELSELLSSSNSSSSYTLLYFSRVTVKLFTSMAHARITARSNFLFEPREPRKSLNELSSRLEELSLTRFVYTPICAIYVLFFHRPPFFYRKVKVTNNTSACFTW